MGKSNWHWLPTTAPSTKEPSFFGINRHGKLRYSWAVGLGPFKPGRGS